MARNAVSLSVLRIFLLAVSKLSKWRETRCYALCIPKSRSEEGDENQPLTAKLEALPERFQPVKTSGKLPILSAVRKRTEGPAYATIATTSSDSINSVKNSVASCPMLMGLAPAGSAGAGAAFYC